MSNNQEEEKASSTSSLEATIISKPAKTDHPINELMAKRWSARAFSSRPVEREKLLSVLEAGRWAPSSRNEQPWRYIVFTNDNPEKLKKAQSVLKDINNYAKRAPILICAITKKTYSDNTNFNRLHFHDLGAANENMFLEAFNQGLIMHEMGGFDVQKAREVFNIPDDFEVGIMIAIGYQDIHHVLPESLRQKAHLPRERKPLSEIAFSEELGNGII
ncbi:MAG TPA: nitroreductase family protein [Nitrososphaeraceae archaeon]|nr:nitroreductase family protein [Nitrososphaeraceae archaeon]